MRTDTKRLFAAGVVICLSLAASGCVTKKLFRRTAGEQDQKISGARTAVEENERRIGDLKSETRTEIDRLDGKVDTASRDAQQAMTRADKAEKMARGKVLWNVTLTNDLVRFDHGGTAIPDSARAVLDDLANDVKALNKTVYLEIEGHTDSTGSNAYNKVLGEKRAESVRRYLNEMGGIPLHVMNVVSYGEERPVTDNATSDGRSMNRRVVVRVLE